MDVTPFLLLGCLGLAITAQAQDCSRPVGGPNMELKNNDILLNEFPDGSQVTFACAIGYMTSGSGVITCTAGTWSNVNMKCTLKNCGAFDEVPNGEIDYREGTNFGAKIVISCNTGYVLVGKGQIVCGDGGWEGRAPSCEVMTCDPPPAFSGGSFSPDKESYDYREVIQYTCNKELTLNGSSAVSCSEHGKFTPHPPTCVRVQCEEPVIKNGDWVQGSRPPYGFRATLTYKCKKGFEIKGDATFTCDINSRWSPALPTCNRVTCAKRPAKVDHGSFSPDKESYQYEDVVQYSCANGFELQGSNSITCSADGTFKPAPPRCNPTKGTGAAGGSDKVGWGLGIGLGSLGLIAVGLAVYFFGIPALKRYRGTDTTVPENEAPKGEHVPLSQQA